MAIDNLKGFAHVGFYVNDMEVSQRFYCDVLGFEVVFERQEAFPEGGYVKIAFLKLNDMMFEMIDIPGVNNSPEGCFQHIAFQVEDIEGAQKKLNCAGVRTEELVFSEETFENGAKWVTFLGPDGEHLEITEVL